MSNDDWPSRSTSCIVWYYLGPFLAASVTGLRLFVRVKKVGWIKLAIDDILVFLATVSPGNFTLSQLKSISAH